MSNKMLRNVLRLNPIGLLILLGCAIFFVGIYVLRPSENRRNLEGQLINLKHLLSVGIEAVESGGREVVQVYKTGILNGKSKGKTQEGANDPLTDGDLRSHLSMYRSLKDSFPLLNVISEEHNASEGNPRSKNKPLLIINPILEKLEDANVLLQDVTVWIDPLDATQEYTEGLLEFVTTMVCVAYKKKPLIGIIHHPFSKETAWAWIGHGFSPGLASSFTKLVVPVLVVSRSHAGKVDTIARKSFGPNIGIMAAGGAGHKALLITRGLASAYIHSTYIKKWDVCAGNAILLALGGNMTTLKGENILYGVEDGYLNRDGILATMVDHQAYLEKLKDLK